MLCRFGLPKYAPNAFPFAFVCLALLLGRVANPQTQQVLAKIRESETKLIVLFSSGVDTMKNWAVQCGSPILFDCMRHCKDKPMEIENPLEVDPANRSILVNFMSLTKEQLRPIFAYDRIFMPRVGAAMKEQLVQYLKEMGETVAIHAVGMNDVIGALAADIVLCPNNAPMLVHAQSSVILPSREQVHLVNLFEASTISDLFASR